ncbi:VaFE repeat-containing surface-anchored protein [Enterococcus hirae]
MRTQTKVNWLKTLAILAFSQLFFFTGTFQVQAEETPETTIESTVPAVTETEENQSVSSVVPTEEHVSEIAPVTEAPVANSKEMLDQTIGESQNSADSPVVSQVIKEETPVENTEETTTVQSSEPIETPTEHQAVDLMPSVVEVPKEEGTNVSVEETNDRPKSNEMVGEKQESKQEKETNISSNVDVKETTLSDEEVAKTFVVPQSSEIKTRSAQKAVLVANNNVVTMKLAGQGINWAVVNDPGYPQFTFNGIPMFSVNGQTAFCIEPGVPFNGNGQAHSTEALDIYLADVNKRNKIKLLSYFGYVNNSDKSMEQYFTTQLMIGEVLGRQIVKTYAGLNFEARKNAIQKLVDQFHIMASFDNQTKTVKVGEPIKVPDTNGFLSRVKDISAPDGISVKIEGNQLVITATKEAPENARIELSQIKITGAPIVFKKPGSQTIGVLNPTDPGRSVLKLVVLKQGNLEIQKIDADTKKPLANAEIKVTFDGKTQTVKTDANGKATIKNITHGTKGTVVEIKAPTGYVINNVTKNFTVEANKTITVTLENKVQLGSVTLYKEDTRTGEKAYGENYTLSGAVYGLYSAKDNKKIQSVTLQEVNGKVQATVEKLALGLYYFVEEKAPVGYILDQTKHGFELKYGGQDKETVSISLTVKDQAQLGIARIFKEDAETGNQAQGVANLENAVYGLYQADGTKIKSVTLKNINGRVQAEVKDLKLGKYFWLEEQAPIGYNLNTDKLAFELVYGGQDKETVIVETIAKDNVIKGTIEGVKVGNKDFVDTNTPDNKPKLAGIEITLTSKTTGKVVKSVLTDTDGYFTFGRNATVYDTYIVSETKGKEGYKLFEPFEVTISEQDQTFRYVLEDKIIEQQLKIVKVDQDTGEVIALADTEFKIFDTLANRYLTMPIPNDTELTDIFRTNAKGYLVANGTLTYGINRYRIEEINAPKNYVLNKTPLVFSITDDQEPIKIVQFGDPKARKNVKLVKYEEWNGKKTVLAGVTFTLYDEKDKALGEYTTDKNGEILVKGLLAGEYYFLEKAPLESFQANTDKQVFTVAFKQNAPDNNETLLVSVRNYLIPPTIGTQATNKEDGEKVVDPLETIVINDSVSYTNLFVGKEYVISGVLMDKATHAPILQDGKEITSTLTFIADKANGTKDLEFVVNASLLKGQTIVVFEKMYRDGIEVAAHEEIDDEGQSVKVNHPALHTTAIFEDGLKIADPTGLFTLNDTVEISEILVGKPYMVKGILMDKATGEALLVHGNPVKTNVGFIAKAENETVVVPFFFDLTDLNGREIVVFESLFRNDEELVNHNDMTDEGQTVRVTNPEIRTTATHKPTGLKVVNPLSKVTITDVVKYHDLIVGKTYTINGVLMDRESEKPVLVNGKEVTSQFVFVAETTDGTVDLEFVLDARALRGKEVVVFEDLLRDDVNLASHADITDKDQTIKIVNPTITTKATNENGGKEILALPNQKVIEWVQVNGLAIGQLYKLIVQGYLTPDGTPFEGTHAEKIFTADKEMMEFLFEFLVDGRNLADKGLSFSEWLQAKTEEEEETFEEVATHNVDLTNEDQTVHFVEAPKAPQPDIPTLSQIQSVPEIKQAQVVPMLPKTGSKNEMIWVIIGVVFVLAASMITYQVYRKEN